VVKIDFYSNPNWPHDYVKAGLIFDENRDFFHDPVMIVKGSVRGVFMAFSRLFMGFLALITLSCASTQKSDLPRPNIIWIVVEDMSSDFGYQGQKLVKTPHVDRLAREGVVFEKAYISAPVCSAARSAMVTGMYQTAIGAHHHRSSRGKVKINLPSHVKLIPKMFREAGYYSCNGFIAGKNKGKTDYNFVFDQKDTYDAADWSKRKPGQPFFAQIQLRGGKLRNGKNPMKQLSSKLSHVLKPKEVTPPPYYPNDAVFKTDWANYLNTVQYTDFEVGQIMERLKKEKLLDNTVIFFITDHGVSQVRGKQFLYEEGAHIPFIVWAPKRLKAATRQDPIVHIDMAATSLELAGIEIPKYLQSKPLFGSKFKAREFVVSARDRCDETVDRIRCVVKGDFKYIKNFYPGRPYLQPCAYKDHKPWMKHYRDLYKVGKLNKAQSLHLADSRPPEELYDLNKDPFEINNLAGNSKYQKKLKELGGILSKWVIDSNDRGAVPESDALYDSDMAVYLGGQKRRKNLKYAKILENNIKIMKKWKAQGK
jgi:arylsulfatase A-like enzyme